MDTAVSPIDIPLMPTPSTSSASPSVELRPDFEVLSNNATDLSSAHTSPDEVRSSQGKDCEVLVPESRNSVVGQAGKNKKVVYESQISPELEGIKLKIKKSPTQDVSAPAAARKRSRSEGAKQRAPRAKKPTAGGKARKRKKKKKGQSDEGSENEEQDLYEQYNGYAVEEVGEPDTDRAQSEWAAERMPPEILTKIFMELTYTEGCVPTLVR